MVPDEQIIATDTARAGGASKALGVLAAVSAGGLMVLRMKHAPLFFLAGAAAAALLGRRRVIAPVRPLELMPEQPREVPVPAAPPPAEVEAWLARQIERDQQVPVITLDVLEVPEAAPPAPEPLETARAALKADPPSSIEEVPPSLFLDVPSLFEDKAVTSAPSPFFDTPAPPAVPVAEPDGAGFQLPEQEPFLAPEAAESVTAPAAARPPVREWNAAWLLGIEPLPSWDELAAEPSGSGHSTSTADAAFLAEPPGASTFTPQPAPAPVAPPVQPAFIPTLFQGGALPDEIMVAEAPAAPETEPEAEPVLVEAPVPSPQPLVEPLESVMASLFVPAPVPEPVVLPVEVVPVTLAEPGEASFDDPLAILAENPSSLPGGPPPPPPLRPLAPMVEAEIIVRPRGLGQQSVQAKHVELPIIEPEPSFVAKEEPLITLEAPFEPSSTGVPEQGAPSAAPAPLPYLPPAPVVLPREQKARKTWRSWWRGD